MCVSGVVVVVVAAHLQSHLLNEKEKCLHAVMKIIGCGSPHPPPLPPPPTPMLRVCLCGCVIYEIWGKILLPMIKHLTLFKH